jgi:3-dehydroquinate dehydratase/shikimate dehydrogenase
MTLLVTSILAESLGDLVSRAERAWAGGADGVEVRMDAFDGDPGTLAEYLKAHKDRSWIVTCRSAEEGGCFRGDTMERVSRLIAAARGTGAYVDFELADWRRSDNIRQKVGLAAAHCVGADTPPSTPDGSDPPPHKTTLSAAASTDGQSRRLILSSHDFERCPENLDAVVHEMIDAHRAVAKVAYRGAHIVDSFAALDVMHEHGSSVMAVCMGEEGLWTRVLAKKFNAFGSFCTLAADEATAPGQTTLGEMIGSYRWKNIDRSTKVYGVLGDPIVHSISPFLFNRWFADTGINAVYLPMRVGANGDGLARFLDGCMKRPWLDVGGFSVTIPHKVTARAWVGEGADSLSQRIGAINTLVFDGGRPTGYNTDCYAAITSMCNALRCDRSDLAGLPVDVLGSGGAARAVVEGLRDFGCRVTVYGRTPQRTKSFADECGVMAAAWEDRGRRRGEVLVNCTPVGMWPKVNESPIPADSLGGCRLVFDLIYRPLQTQLLHDATTAGCATLNGLDMFVRQAAMQFELWTGRAPDLQQARDLVTRGIHTP